MRTRVVVASSVAGLVLAVMSWAPAPAAGQTPSRIGGGEAAREASLRTEAESAKLWEAELARRKAEAVPRVYDPGKPVLSAPPRTPWGDPDLRGYYLTATYTPLQRPSNIDRPLYTAEESIGAFQAQVDTDAGADPAVVHYDWKEYGMEAWQSPVRPNMRTGLIVDPQNGTLPPLTPEAQKRQADVAAQRRARDHQTGVQIFGNLYTRCILGGGAAPLIRGGRPGSAEATSAGVTTEVQIFPDFGPRCDRSAKEHRCPDRSAGWASAPSANRPTVVRQLTWPLGGQHPCRRDHQFQRPVSRHELPGIH